MERHAVLGHRRGQPLAQIEIEAAQRQFGAKSHMRFTPEPAEDAGEFDRDIARADHQQTLRESRKVENLVGADRQFDAGNPRRHHRRAARGDQDRFRPRRLAIGESHGFAILHHGALADQFDAGFFEILRVKALEPGDFLFLGGDEARPVETRRFDAPAKARGVIEGVAKAAREHIEFFRHAASDDAGPADAKFFRDGDAGAMVRGDARRANPARTRANDDKIEFPLRHWKEPGEGALIARLRQLFRRRTNGRGRSFEPNQIGSVQPGKDAPYAPPASRTFDEISFSA